MTDGAPRLQGFDGADGDQSWLVGDESGGGKANEGSPAWLLIVAAAGLAISALALAGGVAIQILGYLAASLLLFTAIAWFRRRSMERAARQGIAASRSLNVLALVLLVCGFALSLLHAWDIAIHFS